MRGKEQKKEVKEECERKKTERGGARGSWRKLQKISGLN